MNTTDTNRLGYMLDTLATDAGAWADATFGTPAERGPIGALRHLKLECDECIAGPGDIMEYADCFLLLLDAARRAGISPAALIRAASTKLGINKRRTWPRPSTQSDAPVSHAKGDAKYLPDNLAPYVNPNGV